ncbi:MAG: ABC transporter permease [Phycisphaerae bacterium]|nr:ABC transporter permease [Phycisphaerae bacterium]
MLSFILRRLAVTPVIVLIVYTITFSLTWLVPGDPLQQDEGRRPPAEIVEAMRKQYKLDDPVGFYVEYLGKASGVAWVLGTSTRPFDLGPSLRHRDWTVNEIIATGLPVSITLGLTAILLALVIGITAGVIGGLRPNGLADLVAQFISLVGISVPSFVVGAAILMLFAAKLQWFPIGGWGDIRFVVLPAFALSLPYSAYIARLVRYGMIEQMTSDYARTARAKGRSRTGVAMRHVLKNAFLPVLSYLGPAAATAMTGSFVVEKVFAVPGIGQHFVDGVVGKDITLVMGVVLVYSTMLVLFNLAVDVMYRYVDPRIEVS